jgi:hypothetical protein
MRLLRGRKVRLHQLDPGPSIEGVLVGKPWRNAGHYVLRQPGMLESANRTVMFDGPEAWVPREKVLFIEVLA